MTDAEIIAMRNAAKFALATAFRAGQESMRQRAYELANKSVNAARAIEEAASLPDLVGCGIEIRDKILSLPILDPPDAMEERG